MTQFIEYVNVIQAIRKAKYSKNQLARFITPLNTPRCDWPSKTKKLYILYNQVCITNRINALSVNVIFFKSTHINSVLCRCFFVIYVLFQQNFCPNIYRLCAETYFYSRDYFICFRIDFSLTCRVVGIYFISIQVNL